MKNIVLIGFMGCGKTTLGHMAQEALNYHFVDTDALLTEQFGMPISEFFTKHGESHFRHSERNLVQQLIDAKLQHHIVSTGGGIITSPDVRQILPHLGFVVWLDASAETIYNRTRHNNSRPLLNTPDPLTTIHTLLDERKPLYRETCHIRLNTDELSFQEVLTGILESASYYFGTVRS